MSEPLPPGLPARLPVPDAPTPPPFAATLAAGRRRRRRRAAELTGCCAALVAVAAAGSVLPQDRSDDRLSVGQPRTEASAPATQAPAPTARPTPRQTAPTPRSVASRAVLPPALPIASTPAAEPTPAAEQPRPVRGTQPPAAPPGQEVGPPSERVAARAGSTCDGSGPTPAQGWCSYYDGDEQAERGGQATLAAAVCRLAGQGPGRLTTGNGEQARFAVGEDTQPAQWSWRHGRRFSPEGTTLTVPPGECIRWFVSWDLTGNDGQALPPGDYYLEAFPLVSAGGTSASMDTNQRFRITG